MKKDNRKKLSTLFNPLKNIHLLAFLLFVIWMVFFDAHKLSTQLNSSNKLSTLELEKVKLLDKIEKTNQELEGLKVNKEKFAREQYYMKKDDEDVFIIDITK